MYINDRDDEALHRCKSSKGVKDNECKGNEQAVEYSRWERLFVQTAKNTRTLLGLRGPTMPRQNKIIEYCIRCLVWMSTNDRNQTNICDWYNHEKKVNGAD